MAAKRDRLAPPKKKMTEPEFEQELLIIGLMSQLLESAADYEDPDDVPVTVTGEPLSETDILDRC